MLGPMVSLGGWRPLEGWIGQSIVIAILASGVAAFGGIKWAQHRKKAKALTEGISASDKVDSDEVVLKDKLKDALATLKTSSGGKKDYLYDLPWYLLIGPPGSGK